jgi:hypothetical protein
MHERQKLTASDAASGDRFGEAVSISGEWGIIGASYSDYGGTYAGSAYVFRRDDHGTALDPSDDFWIEQAKLVASDAYEGKQFGDSVSISDDYAVVGAWGGGDSWGVSSGAAYMFRRDDPGTPSDPNDDYWIEVQKLIGSDTAYGDHFGWSVSISGDRAIVGAHGDNDAGGDSGSAYVFRRDDNGTALDPSDDLWIEETKLTATDAAAQDSFGTSVSISDGRAIVAAVGDDDAGSASGSAYVFRRDENGTPSDPSDDLWVQEDKLTASDAAEVDWFGYSVSISGDWAVVGAKFDDDSGDASGSVYVFKRNDNGTPLDASDDYWIEVQKLAAPDPGADDKFGSSVSIRGTHAIVGAGGARSTHVYWLDDNDTPLDPSDDLWAYRATHEASDGPSGGFGASVSIDGLCAMVGAPFNVHAGASRGSAFFFTVPITGPVDCNLNDIPDECETDCNGNGVHDDCDLAEGTSYDCNTNGIPDECEDDCNRNGLHDSCDIAGGTSGDCNGNGIPDECEDCNENGLADECDLAAGTSEDCNVNQIPDECEQDCNANGVPDDCDIADGVSSDCNVNAILDECDLTAGASRDCDNNDIPDECQRDCNGNGLDDGCDIAEGTSEDCQPNGIPDECESDCNNNDVPDDCDRDNGITVPCAFIEFAPGGSTGPFQVDRNEMIIPAGDVQVEFEILVSGWGNVPGSPLLGACNMVFEAESVQGYHAIPPAPGVNLTTPYPFGCELASNCPVPSPPPVVQTGTCGILFRGYCDDWVPGYFLPKVCSDDLATPCASGNDCAGEALCTWNPRFVWSPDMNPFNHLTVLPDNSIQWATLPWIIGVGREDPDGTTKFLVGVLRLIIPGNAKGTYAINFRLGPDYTFLIETDPWNPHIPSSVFHGQLTIGGACCVAERSCEILLESECEDIGGTYVGGFCAGEIDPCMPDCNGNGVGDADDIAGGTSQDCNENGIPDECDADDDGDGVINECDGCPGNPNKIEPGRCGCADDDGLDSDGDSVLDCIDQCPGVDDGVFAPDCAAAIPAVSEWGLIIMAILLLAGGKIYFGRAHHANCL